MMVEARNDCYFSPADKYTPLVEMIQQFKVESCETELHMGSTGPRRVSSVGILQGLLCAFLLCLNHKLMCS